MESEYSLTYVAVYSYVATEFTYVNIHSGYSTITYTILAIITKNLHFTGTLPSEADYLLAYATIPGYVSWRNNQNGSWFVSALVSVFMEMADKVHLLDMLTEVNRRVAEEFESTSGKRKQVPEPVSRLRKRLYFNPGNHNYM